MNDELPIGWVAAPLGSVTIEPIQRIPETSEKITYIDIGSVDRDTKKITKPQTLLGKNAPSRARKVIKTGDVLVSMVRPNLNAVALVDPQYDGQFASTGFDVLRSLVIDPRWIFYSVRTPAFVEKMTELVQGALYPAVRSKDIRAFVIPIAPLSEQKRIVDKLEELLGQVEDCRGRIDCVQDLLKRFRQSVLAAAISGQLTNEWRKANKQDWKPWMERRLGQLCEKKRIITYGVIKLGDEIPNGVPCLRTSNVKWLSFDTNGIKRIAKSLSQDYSRTILKGGEVLVNVRGTLGGVAVVPEDMAGWNVSREVAVIPVDQNLINSAFLAFSIGSQQTQCWLSRVEKGVAYTGINIGDLRDLPISFPGLPEQKEIIRRVEALFAFADGLESRLTSVRAQVERLQSGTLAKAFRGELVSRDTNDQSASELLRRLQEQHQSLKLTNRLNTSGNRKSHTRMKTNESKPILKVLMDAVEPLSTAELFTLCGHPSNADSKCVESFFVELRTMIESGEITKKRIDNNDYFKLKKQ